MKYRMLVAALLLGAAMTPAGAVADDKKPRTAVEVLNAIPEDAWRPLDLENTLVIDLPAGPVVVEMRPDFAPAHVERIKTLVRRGFYDGIFFHRVIEGFVAQGGDPVGDGTGGSDLPDLPPEFARDTNEIEGFVPIGRDRIAARVGFLDGMPVAADPETLRSFLTERKVTMWGAHCPGVMSMARANAPDSANSQYFIMIGDARLSLDQRYTTWGWIVDGFDATRRIARGEPPGRPTPVVRMRIATDMPANRRPEIEVMRTDHPVFLEYIKAAGFVREDGFVRDLCAIKPPRRIEGLIYQ